ncbi:hypothetical protein Vadar_028393 [Vaccinium darrowii]|uniref:Uncharacterized protein n=1 Tax=Vaccinium darrowii TaxID=229202 RepID=A0ACB7Z0R5_9ERIC|nr:hypothetical protein Vadar_028393 [Vaccinium darrowii]
MEGYQLQTPINENQQANRSTSKAISRHTKQTQNFSKKSLNSVFMSVSEDALLESPTNSIKFFPISEVYNQLSDSAESCIGSPDPLISPSSNADLAPLLPNVTAENKQKAGDIINHINSTELKNCAGIVSVEVEMVVHHLKQAQIRLMSSANSDLQTKKLLDTLIGLVIEEFTALPEEKDQFSELVSLKTRVVYTSFFLWILVVCLVLLFSFRVQSSFNEPPPT